MRRTAINLLSIALLSAVSAQVSVQAQAIDSSCISGLCSTDGLILNVVDYGNPNAAPTKAVSSLYTSQEPVNFKRRLRVLAPDVAKVTNGQLAQPIAFYIDSNYMDFIEQWELEIGYTELQGQSGEVDTKVIKRYASNQVTIGTPITWSGDSNVAQLKEGTKLTYRLKAYDKYGNVDVTLSREIALIGPNNQRLMHQPDERNWYQRMGDTNDLEIEGIDLPGATLVRYHLEDLNPGDRVQLSRGNVNAIYPTGGKSDIVVERIFASGHHDSQVNIVSSAGVNDQADVPLSIDNDYFFMVALADITIGRNIIEDGAEFAKESTDYRYYNGDTYTDGRLAFYLKGKIKGETLITAQMDTGTGELKDLFKGIHEKDRGAIFRRIDPDLYYPVYGDDSTITRDVDTAGKLYVRIERDKSEFIWGNYNTGISGNSLANYNRSLYGAKGVLAAPQRVENGESRASITAFASEADTLAAQDRFMATGGSLYYLRHQDLALGSAKVRKIFLDAQGFERRSITLQEGKDFDINEYQGRIILKRPFQQIGGTAGTLNINSLDTSMLVVDYEYIPDGGFTDIDELNVGVRAKG